MPTGGHPAVRPFWSPVVAGIAMGLVLIITFSLSGHGVGASDAVTHMVAGTGLTIAAEATKANAYLGPMVSDGNPMGSRITLEVLGMVIGGIAAAFMAGRFRVQLDGQRSIGTPQRVTKALIGGFLAGFGARIAGGCTSGLGLSGAATLGVAAFGFWAMRKVGLMAPDTLAVPPALLMAAAVGGALVGAGFAAGGYCTGTSLVAMSSGRLDAIVFFVGLFGGTYGFAAVFGPAMRSMMAMGTIAEGDNFTDAYGVPEVTMLAILAASLVTIYYLGGWFERRGCGPVNAEQAVAGAE
jgi:uncharacterized membrane protein YedE/YeeE